MVRTINRDDIRHLNLFNKITHVNTRFCFPYNNSIIFCVPRGQLSRALGEEGKNIYELKRLLGKRIKVIPQPLGIQDAKQFIINIVRPVTFKGMEIHDKEIVITAGGMQNKAMLLGRNKQRLLEMQEIVKDFFGKDLMII